MTATKMLAALLLATTLVAGPERPVSRAMLVESRGIPYALAAADDRALLLMREDHGVVGVRVGRDGQAIDERPIAMSTGWASYPDVARGVDHWLVVWQTPTTVQGRLVHDDGTTGRVIELGPAGLYYDHLKDLSVAFDGTHFLVAWILPKENPWGYQVESVRLDVHGEVVEHRTLVSMSSTYIREVEVASSGRGGFEVVVAREDDIFGLERVEAYRVDSEVHAPRRLDREGSAGVRSVTAGFDGSTLVVAWMANPYVLFMRREGGPSRVVSPGTWEPVSIVTIGGSGSVYVMLRNGELISEDGTVRRKVGTSIHGGAAVSFGDRALIATHMRIGERHHPATLVVDASLQELVKPVRLAVDPVLQHFPSVARNAYGEALAVWVEHTREGVLMAMAALLDVAGRPVNGPLSLGPIDIRPEVASDGADFLVLLPRPYLVRRDGTVTSRTPLPGGAAAQCLAWNGGEYVRARLHSTQPGPPYTAEVRVTHVAPDGIAVAVDERVVVPAMPQLHSLSCAAGRDTTLFVYTTPESVNGVFLADGGTVSAPFPIGPNAKGGSPIRTAVAAQGNTFLVAWQMPDDFLEWAVVNEHGTVTRNEHRQRNELTVLGEDPLAAAPYRDGFLLAWGTDDVEALAIDLQGDPVGSATPVVASPFSAGETALAGGDTVLAVYHREIGPLPGRRRVFTRVLGETIPSTRGRAVRH